MTNGTCIAKMLRNHQTTSPIDFTITHGKGRHGVIICQHRRFAKFIGLRNFLKRITGGLK